MERPRDSERSRSVGLGRWLRLKGLCSWRIRDMVRLGTKSLPGIRVTCPCRMRRWMFDSSSRIMPTRIGHLQAEEGVEAASRSRFWLRLTLRGPLSGFATRMGP